MQVKTDEGGVLVALVKSSKGDGKYEIRKHGIGVWTCTCPAYRFTRGKSERSFHAST